MGKTKKIVDFMPGDTVRVYTKIVEGNKTRLQSFQGTVICKRGEGVSKTFTVRKVTGGIGVERIFPLHSPNIAKIQQMKKGKVRRAKLFYLRKKKGKKAKVAEKKKGKPLQKIQPVKSAEEQLAAK